MATIEKRDIAIAIILSIITLGIFALYWMYRVSEDSNALLGRQWPVSSGILILLTIVTFGIYGFYWYYMTGQAWDEYIVNRENGMAGSRGVVYLILSIVGLSIVNLALIQNELNQRATVA